MSDKIKIHDYIYPIKFSLIFLIFITLLISAANIGIPWTYKLIFDTYLPSFDNKIFFNILFLIILYILIVIFYCYSISFSTNYIKSKLSIILRIKILQKILNYKYNFFLNNSTGKLLDIIIPETDKATDVLINFCKAFSYMMQFIAFFLILFFFNINIFYIYISIFIFYFIWTNFFKKKIVRLNKKIMEMNDENYMIFHQIFSNIREIKSYVLKNHLNQKFDKLSLKYKKKSINLSATNSFLSLGSTIPIQIGNILIIILGFYKILSGEFTIGLTLTIMAFSGIFMNPLLELSKSISIIQNGWVSLKRIKSVLIEEKEEDQNGNLLTSINKKIKFSKITFSFDNKNIILKKLDLDLPVNNFITIVGETGSGKSTIINLILKLFYINNGSIYFDDNDINTLQTNSIREKTGVVIQDIFIFNDTFKNNIDLNKSLSDEKIYDIIKQVELSDLLKRLPDGLNSILSDSGMNLSGGEKQRLLLARCLVKNPNIIILDEVTSALDLKTENKIIKTILNIKKLKKNILILAITHRPSFAKYSDIICVLDKGRITEIGNHNELIKSRGLYYKLFNYKDNKK